jgi:hypothetical protein
MDVGNSWSGINGRLMIHLLHSILFLGLSIESVQEERDPKGKQSLKQLWHIPTAVESGFESRITDRWLSVSARRQFFECLVSIPLPFRVNCVPAILLCFSLWRLSQIIGSSGCAQDRDWVVMLVT